MDSHYFTWLKEHTHNMSHEPYPLGQLKAAVVNNCRIKAEVVQEDPHEQGKRRILNYGHTIGHAIEKLSDFTIPHGAAVSIGMMVEGVLAVQFAGFSDEELRRQHDALVAAGLPVKIPRYFRIDEIIEATKSDKKAADGKARYALPQTIGEMNPFDGSYATIVDERLLKSVLEVWRV
jgi:3-dehydroquinate synthase